MSAGPKQTLRITAARPCWRALPVVLSALMIASAPQPSNADLLPVRPAVADPSAAPEAATGLTASAEAVGRGSMVVAANPFAAEAGRRILRQGGSALDAAIAVQMVLNLVEPQSSGIGGGAFIVTWDAKAKRVRTFDGRETAPAAARPDRFIGADGKPLDFDTTVRSGRSIGVPGVLRALELAHARHGQLGWQKLFVPAIELAEGGFVVQKRLGELLGKEKPEFFAPGARAYFFPDGAALQQGAAVRNPEFAATLRAIAKGGADALYEGPLAAKLVADARAAGSDLTRSDLADYRARERAPVCMVYRMRRVCGMGLPSSGGLTIGITLGLLEAFDLGQSPLTPPALQAIAEAEKLAFADRERYFADPDRVKVPDGFLSADYLRARRALIDLSNPMVKAPPGDPQKKLGLFGIDTTVEASGTSQISIVDARGNAVAMTTSVEGAFGSHIMSGGFLLNNQLTDFAFEPKDAEGRDAANRVEPGKRPRSSMAPTLVFNTGGELFAVTGSPGGSRIIPYVVKSLVCLIDWSCGAVEAVSLVNFGSRNGPFEVEEGDAGAPVAAAMRERGNAVTVAPMPSGINLIVRRGDRWVGASDPRRDGVALAD
jgi:gamma-glutamyltranspeptidase / glutathione hydrolase